MQVSRTNVQVVVVLVVVRIGGALSGVMLILFVVSLQAFVMTIVSLRVNRFVMIDLMLISVPLNVGQNKDIVVTTVFLIVKTAKMLARIHLAQVKNNVPVQFVIALSGNKEIRRSQVACVCRLPAGPQLQVE